MTTRKNQILLVDAYAAIYRSFHAIRELNDPSGAPVNALYGMARFGLKVDQEFPSAYAAFVLDKGKCVRRLEILEEYKATRPPMPDKLRAQIPMIREWFAALGWPVVEQEGWEADDLIALAVKNRDGLPVHIVSHDKDLAQLVRKDVLLVRAGKKGQWAIVTPEKVEEQFGVGPERIQDYLALVGDASDNIPGVPGVGPKTAAALLNEYGCIDNLMANLDRVSRPSLRRELEQQADSLRRNRELIRLDTADCDAWQGLEGIRRGDTNWDALFDIARKHRFDSLVSTLQKTREQARSPRLL